MINSTQIFFGPSHQKSSTYLAAVFIFLAAFINSIYNTVQTGNKLDFAVQKTELIKTNDNVGKTTANTTIFKYWHCVKQDNTNTSIIPLKFFENKCIDADLQHSKVQDIKSLYINENPDKTNNSTAQNNKTKYPPGTTVQKISHAKNLATSEIIIIIVSVIAILLFLHIISSFVGKLILFLFLLIALIRACFWVILFTYSYYDKADNLQSILISDAFNFALENSEITYETVQAYVSHSLIVGSIGWTASSLLVISLILVCFRQHKNHWDDPENLLLRRKLISRIALIAGILFSIAVYRVNVLIKWPSTFLPEYEQSQLTYVSQEVLFSFGLNLSLGLALIFITAILIFRRDVDEARAQIEDSALKNEIYESFSEDYNDLRKQLSSAFALMPAITASLPPALTTFATIYASENYMRLTG